MNTEELQKQIENLPEKDKQTIQKMEKMDDNELENAVGGLSNKAKTLLINIGGLLLAAGSGAFVGYNAGRRADKSNRNYAYHLGMKVVMNQVRDEVSAEYNIPPEFKKKLEKNFERLEKYN
jgi:hypothetical protein